MAEDLDNSIKTIAADKYLESKKASRAKGLGIKLAKISPGGTV